MGVRRRTVKEWISRGGKQGVPWDMDDRLFKEMDTWLPQIVPVLANISLIGLLQTFKEMRMISPEANPHVPSGLQSTAYTNNP